ncbi:hypothetical protein [Synechococcus phage S-N03]|uniref:Uncharacterized protein n=1 Tax=Synechococcus phage S-N03 TaxID=2718943 RepID=A0A6G8R5W0_9CAUD|nr:hypothetical protein PQC09_gp141 [Synechococcus phage S-N03]QIN96776.1 hypothetical protein [Synechococcus phage S-N03]
MKNFEEFKEQAQEELEESSLSRLAKKAEKGGTAYMSAERADKSKKENKARTKQLAKDIRGAGLPGPTKVEGQYKEAGQDEPSKEQSYAISSGKKGKKAFKKAVKKLGKKYDQDSVLIQKDKDTDAKLHATSKAGKEDLGKWDGKVGKMKPGGKGDMQTRIKGKTFTMEEYELLEDLKTDLQIRASKGDKEAMKKLKELRAAGKIGKERGFEPGAKRDIPDMKKIMGIEENYGDNKYDPKKLEKELPKGVKYGKETQGKGDHKHRTVEVDGKETDMQIGGAAKGKSSTYSPSWADGHRKVKKTLDGIDKTVKEIQGEKKRESSDTAKRMAKAAAKRAREHGDKIISDITGVGRKTNRQGKGSKAARRMDNM